MAEHKGAIRPDGANLAGRVVVITGGNAGIGKEAAVALARRHATVVITSRDAERGRRAQAEIRDRTGGDSGTGVDLMPLDLASLASVRRFATDLLDRHDRLDVLLNNAGLILSRRTETEDGFETTFGVNHLGHFLLTNLLLERLRTNADGARVVNVSSHAHKAGGARRGLDFDDLHATRRYAAFPVYCRSKLANLLFTRELSRRLAGDAVTVNALHPGFVRSDFARDGDTRGLYALGVRLGAPFAISPEKGARTSVYLASAPEVEHVTGEYFYKCRPARPSSAATDDEAGRRLWAVSEQLVGER